MFGAILLANFLLVSDGAAPDMVESAIVRENVVFADIETLTDKARRGKTRLASSGSGFFVSPDGRLVTNHHVVDGAEELVVVASGVAWRVRIAAQDKKEDLALLEIDGFPGRIVASDAMRSEKRVFPVLSAAIEGGCDIGDEVYTIGYPNIWKMGIEVKVTKGVASSLAGSLDKLDAQVRGHRFQIDAAIQGGNSGGPVVDERGRLVGAVVSGFGAGYMQNVNYAIRLSAIEDFLFGKAALAKAGPYGKRGGAAVREATRACALVLNYESGSRPLPFDDETKDVKVRNEERARFEKAVLYAKLLKIRKEWKELKKLTGSLIESCGDGAGDEVRELYELARKELGEADSGADVKDKEKEKR